MESSKSLTIMNINSVGVEISLAAHYYYCLIMQITKSAAPPTSFRARLLALRRAININFLSQPDDCVAAITDALGGRGQQCEVEAWKESRVQLP